MNLPVGFKHPMVFDVFLSVSESDVIMIQPHYSNENVGIISAKFAMGLCAQLLEMSIKDLKR